MELQNRKEVASLLPGNNIVNNTSLVVASRREIFEALLEGDKNESEEDANIIETTLIENRNEE